MPQPVWMTALPDAGTKGAPGRGAMSCRALGPSLRLPTPHRVAILTLCWWDRRGSYLPPPTTCGVGEGAPWTPRRTLLPGCRPERGRTPHAV